MVFELLGWGVETWGYMVLAALAGGAFGAAIGALPAFCFTGFMVIAGQATAILKGNLGGVVDSTVSATGITGSIAFGPVFGPHISFAGGVAAAAYAARRGKMQSGFDYHNAKDITFALGTEPDVLTVGGLFGVLGLVITRASATFSLPWDPIAVAVVLSAVASRLVFRYPIVGRARGRSILDMAPFEREELRGAAADGGDGAAEGGEAMADGGMAEAERLAVEPWLPHQYKWMNVAAIGLVTGLLGGFIALETGSAFLAFGISAASLIFLQLGVEQIPVTHHMTLPASTAALAAAPMGLADPVLLLVAAAFGAYGALAGEVVQRIFYAHSDTHLDPPAFAIVIATFSIAVLYLVGVFPSASWVPIP